MMMKNSRAVFIPAILVSLVSLFLIGYGVVTMMQHVGGHPGVGPNGEMQPHERNVVKEIFNNIGNVAIACGAISFYWLLFKKKLTSSSMVIKKFAKKIYKAHTYVGWAAFVLTVAHGAYFLLDFDHPKYLTGLAAFLLLLAIATYGWLIKRFNNKYMRTSHLILSSLWIVALLIHAGGFMILVTAITLLTWAALKVVDLRGKQKTAEIRATME
ncbi:MAG TPA: hypothetical protein VJ824_10280 [Bacillota bacterium]|nr:hypothetical protein [Bacillota bacterium]